MLVLKFQTLSILPLFVLPTQHLLLLAYEAKACCFGGSDLPLGAIRRNQCFGDWLQLLRRIVLLVLGCESLQFAALLLHSLYDEVIADHVIKVRSFIVSPKFMRGRESFLVTMIEFYLDSFLWNSIFYILLLVNIFCCLKRLLLMRLASSILLDCLLESDSVLLVVDALQRKDDLFEHTETFIAVFARLVVYILVLVVIEQAKDLLNVVKGHSSGT